MALSISTNIPALFAQRSLQKNQRLLAQSMIRLSSGLRIASAADDAAGLAISEGMRARIRSMSVAERNAGDGVSMSQTAEGSLGEVQNILSRMRELSTQASNGTLSSTDRGDINIEFGELQSEVTRIQGGTKYNDIAIIATAAIPIRFQVGVDGTSFDSISVVFGGVALATLLAASTSLDTLTGALSSLSVIDSAIEKVSTSRAKFGAAMNRLESATNNIITMRLHLTEARSRIVDVDIAHESTQLARRQVLVNAGVAVLAQANNLPRAAFSLITTGNA